MYLKLFRNMPQGSAISGRLVIDGRYFCNTLERVGYQIPALCYHLTVTFSPKFKRLLPLVTGVPRSPIGGTPSNSEASNSEASNRAKPVRYPAAICRTGIRFHRGSKPQHSTGCILVPTDKETELTNLVKNAQSNEEIILEVIDFRPGTEHGYNTPCPPELQKHVIDSNRGKRRLNDFHPEK